MESTIKVCSTPNIMKEAFEDTVISIRFMKALDFTDPEPDLDNKVWAEKYGDDELVYEARVRYPEVKRPLCETCTYKSWENVLKALKKRRLER